MKNSNKIQWLVAFTLLFASSISQAKTVYLDDKVRIWSRTGPSDEYKVKYQVLPGTALEVQQTNQETGYVEVKDAQGRIFWMDGKFLTSTPTAQHQLIAAQNKIEQLKTAHANQLEKLQKEVNLLSPLAERNEQLQGQLAKNSSELETLRQKSQMYESGFKTDAFFAGAAVILSGMFVGWLLSKIGGRKRNSGW
jgi:SH3 domain protein